MTRTADQWWAWHDQDSSRWSPGNQDEATAAAEARCAAWIAGGSDDGPESSRDMQLAAARRAAGLTQRQLAERLGCAPARVAEWESGRRRPSAAAQVGIEAALSAPCPPPTPRPVAVAWVCRDEGGEEIIRATTAARAAARYVESGSWGESETTRWIDVYVRRAARGHEDDLWDCCTVTLQPDEPRCSADGGHRWRAEHVAGSGGGVRITDECARCGLVRTVDTWAQRPDTGEQGLRSLTYRRADA